jgi:hypothetical protein
MIKAKHISNLFRRVVRRPNDAVAKTAQDGDEGKAAGSSDLSAALLCLSYHLQCSQTLRPNSLNDDQNSFEASLMCPTNHGAFKALTRGSPGVSKLALTVVGSMARRRGLLSLAAAAF